MMLQNTKLAHLYNLYSVAIRMYFRPSDESYTIDFIIASFIVHTLQSDRKEENGWVEFYLYTIQIKIIAIKHNKTTQTNLWSQSMIKVYKNAVCLAKLQFLLNLKSIRCKYRLTCSKSSRFSIENPSLFAEALGVFSVKWQMDLIQFIEPLSASIKNYNFNSF